MSELTAMTSLKLADDESWLQYIQRLICQIIEEVYRGIYSNC
jgi:hypothetical protein